jgi:hypothetical protein
MADQRRFRRCSRYVLRVAVVSLCGLTALVGLVSAGRAVPGTPAGARSRPAVPAAHSLPAGPARDAEFPDPTVLAAPDGSYYAYSTQVNGVNVPVIRSTDLATWTSVGDALPQLPAWAEPGLTWAPSVIEQGGRFLLYYTSHYRSADPALSRQCISVAVSDTPAGPFRDASPRDPADSTRTRPLICQYDLGGSIDPEAFVDADGARYLLFKSNGNTIGQPARLWATRLRPDGLAPADDPPRFTKLLQADQPWEAGVVEGPAMARWGPGYVLLYSGNWFESAYEAIGAAVCASPLGPCRKAPGPWFSAVPDYSELGRAAGPGGPMLFRDHGGQLMLAFAAWAAPRSDYESGGRRALYLRPARLHEDGSELVPPGTASGTVATDDVPWSPVDAVRRKARRSSAENRVRCPGARRAWCGSPAAAAPARAARPGR